MKRFSLFSFVLSCTFWMTACGLPQGEQCKKYLVCQSYYDEVYAFEAADLSDFDEAGSCWRSDSSAADCENKCSVATERLGAGLESSGEDIGDCN